jgi:hypothetical protein
MPESMSPTSSDASRAGSDVDMEQLFRTGDFVILREKSSPRCRWQTLPGRSRVRQRIPSPD